MAEVRGIVVGIYTSAQILGHFATQTQAWKLLSDRLFDIKEGLEVAELSLDNWQHKYDIHDRRPDIYMHVLFGRHGWDRIQRTLKSVKKVSRNIGDDIDRIINRALAAKPHSVAPQRLSAAYDEELVQECLSRIRRNPSWSRKFNYSGLSKSCSLEMLLERLHRKLTILDRFSDFFLEKEHPGIFRAIQRPPGRRIIPRPGDAQLESVQNSLLDALSARKDADLLHRASSIQGSEIHIGLSVPQIHRRDFAFLLSSQEEQHEILVHPVKIKAVSDMSRLQPDMATAIPTLMRNAGEPCYLLPSYPSNAGFQLSIPPSHPLSDLEYKDPLSKVVREQRTTLCQQVLYPQDQVAVACGIAQGCWRLIGSQWLHFLDCRNVRWRRSADGRWSSMLAAAPGDNTTSHALSQCLSQGDLLKHTHIFRIGLILAEIALGTPISYISHDHSTGGIKIHIEEARGDTDGIENEVDAMEVAAEVELRTNVFMGNIVFFCLSVLQNRDLMNDAEIEAQYYREVLGTVEELKGFLVRR